MSDNTKAAQGPMEVFLAGWLKFKANTQVKNVQNFAGMPRPMPFVRVTLNTGAKIDISVVRGEDLKALAEAVVKAKKAEGDLTDNVFTAISEWLIGMDKSSKKIGVMVCGGEIFQLLPDDENLSKPGPHSGRERKIIVIDRLIQKTGKADRHDTSYEF